MIGFRQTFFAGLASVLRVLAKVPLGIGTSISDLAEACEERSR